MTKKSKTIAVIFAGILIIAGVYAILHSKEREEQSMAENVQNSAPTDSQGQSTLPTDGKKISFSKFVAEGGSYKCEVKQYLSDMENNGTVYINNGNIRGEYSTVAEGKNINTSFILKDGYSYTWSSALPSMGFKLKVNTSTTGVSNNANMSGTYSWNADQIGDYNCVAWTADTTMFALPTGVSFRDMSPK